LSVTLTVSMYAMMDSLTFFFVLFSFRGNFIVLGVGGGGSTRIMKDIQELQRKVKHKQQFQPHKNILVHQPSAPTEDTKKTGY
jgi:hypothetical protein